MSDEELALLSDGASAALTAFFEQQCTFRGSEERNPFDENWNLSQVQVYLLFLEDPQILC